MVDEVRLARLLRGVDDRVARLATQSKETPRSAPLWLDGVKYLFVTAIEGCIDVAHHITASQRWSAAETNAASMRVLGRHGVLTEELAVRMAAAVGFRNVLVHQYADVDDARVLAFLHADLGTLSAFTSAVSSWLLSLGD